MSASVIASWFIFIDSAIALNAFISSVALSAVYAPFMFSLKYCGNYFASFPSPTAYTSVGWSPLTIFIIFLATLPILVVVFVHGHQ